MRKIYDSIESTGDNKYNNLFNNPTYEDIENAKLLALAREKKELNNYNKKTTGGFISPFILGVLIVSLSIIGVLLTQIVYLVY